MDRNDRQQRSENRSLQNNVQLLFIAAGVVFLVAGLALAAIGATSDSIGPDTDDDDDSPGDDTNDDLPGDDTNGDLPDDGNETDDLPGDDNETDDDPPDDDDDGTDDPPDDDDDGTDDPPDNEDPTHTLTVNVQDEAGNPIDGATVGVNGGPDGFEPVEEGNVGGSIEVEVEDGQYTVAADAEGYERAEEAVEVAGEDASVTVTLPASQGGGDTSTLTVVVVDGNENPIPHATVEVAEGGLFGSSEEQNVNGAGEAVFEVDDGTYTVKAEAQGYPTLERDNIEVSGPKRLQLKLVTNN